MKLNKTCETTVSNWTEAVRAVTTERERSRAGDCPARSRRLCSGCGGSRSPGVSLTWAGSLEPWEAQQPELVGQTATDMATHTGRGGRGVRGGGRETERGGEEESERELLRQALQVFGWTQTWACMRLAPQGLGRREAGESSIGRQGNMDSQRAEHRLHRQQLKGRALEYTGNWVDSSWRVGLSSGISLASDQRLLWISHNQV